MEGNINTLQGSVDTIRSNVESLQGSVDTLQDGFNTHKSSFESIVSSMDTTVSSLGITVGNIETTIGTLQTDLGTAQNGLSELRSDFNTHKSTYETSVESIETKVNTLESDFSSHVETSAQEISTINENLGTAQGILTTIQEDISSVQESVSTLESDLSDLRTQFDTHSSTYEFKVDSLEGNFNTLQSEFNTHKQGFSNYQSTTNSKISGVEGTVNTLSENVTSLQGDFNTLSSNFDTLQGDFNTLSSNFDTLQGDFTSHKLTYETKVDDLDVSLNRYTSENDVRVGVIEQNQLNFTTTINNKLNSLEEKDYDSQLQTLSGDVRDANRTANSASNKVSNLEDAVNEFQSTIETITWPNYAYICDLSGGFWSKENIWDPDSNVYPGFCNSCGEATYQLRSQDFDEIDLQQEKILAYLYIPNEYMLTETFQFIKKFNNYCDSYYAIHNSYPYVDGGLTIFLHSSELGYHARNAIANETPENTSIIRNLFKHTCRICILAHAFMNRPHYTEIMNSILERHNSFNGQNLTLPIFSDSTIKVIDFDSSFAWDYLDLGLDFYIDNPVDCFATTRIKRIQFPRELKILNLTSAYYDLEGNELYEREGDDWSLNGFIETLDLPETLWKCFIRIPYNTLKTVYLPTNPDKFELTTSYGNLNFKKATHINYKRTIHNELEFNYNSMSDTHTLYGLSSNTGSGEATEDISKTKNCAVILKNSIVNTYVDVDELSLDIIGTSSEPGGISLFILNDLASYDFDKFLAMFDKGFYYAGSSYYNILTEKFMDDMYKDSSSWHKFKIPFNNRFETLVIDMNNFKDTGRQLVTFRFQAPERNQTTTLAKYNTFQSLVIRNADYPTSILISSRVGSDTSITSAVDAMPYVGNYGTLYNWSLPPAKELKIDMVHPVRLSYIDTTPYYRTEIQQLYLDARCVIKIKDAYVFIKKIYYTSENKKPKLVSDLLTEEELASYEAKCELLPFE